MNTAHEHNVIMYHYLRFQENLSTSCYFLKHKHDDYKRNMINKVLPEAESLKPPLRAAGPGMGTMILCTVVDRWAQSHMSAIDTTDAIPIAGMDCCFPQLIDTCESKASKANCPWETGLNAERPGRCLLLVYIRHSSSYPVFREFRQAKLSFSSRNSDMDQQYQFSGAA